MRLKLDNLTIIVDCNGIQGYDFTKDICPQQRLEDFWRSLGMYFIKINGHDFKELDSSLDKANKRKDTPKCVVAQTVKGKGVSFMENKIEWHYKSPNEEQKKQAVEEIG
jgi:transketolase